MINIDELRNLSEPLKSYNFEVIIPNIPGGGNLSGNDTRLYVNAAMLPGIGSQPITVEAGGHEVLYAGKAQYNHMWQVELREYENLNVITMLQNWHGLQWDRPTGAQSPSADYKADSIYVSMLDSQRNPMKQFRMIGAWIAQIADLQLAYQQNQQIAFPLTFAYDYWIYE
jgi:hypothetical protein